MFHQQRPQDTWNKWKSDRKRPGYCQLATASSKRVSTCWWLHQPMEWSRLESAPPPLQQKENHKKNELKTPSVKQTSTRAEIFCRKIITKHWKEQFVITVLLLVLLSTEKSAGLKIDLTVKWIISRPSSLQTNGAPIGVCFPRCFCLLMEKLFIGVPMNTNYSICRKLQTQLWFI